MKSNFDNVNEVVEVEGNKRRIYVSGTANALPKSRKRRQSRKKRGMSTEQYLERKKWQQIWIDRHGSSKWF